MAIILIADDDASCRMMLRAALQNLGHDVVEASNGKEACAMLAQGAPSLVLLDVLMPEKDGIETIMEIRATHPNLVVIAMSGGGRFPGGDYLKIIGMLGANEILRKPFGLDHLNTVVAKVLTPY